MRLPRHPVLRTLVHGVLLGLLILGVGGRVAMAAIQYQQSGNSSWSLGGSMTVVFLGAASGLAGAAMLLVSRWGAARLPERLRWVGYAAFALLLLLVTMRGLRGTAAVGAWYFYPLVATFGAALARLSASRPGSARGLTPS
jgi:hypothetical protein